MFRFEKIKLNTSIMKIFTLFVLSFTLFVITYGAEISFKTSLKSESLPKGEFFNVDVGLTGFLKPLNVVEGEIILPEGLNVHDISISGSSVTLWTVKPKFSISDRKIIFAGGNPNNFLPDRENFIFSFKLKSDIVGGYKINLLNGKVYRADGLGTSEDSSGSFSFKVKDNINVTESSFDNGLVLTRNENNPLIFDIGSDNSLFDGKIFLTFYGGGNESGVKKYYVKEGAFYSKWQEMETYYVIKNQDLSKKIVVRIENNDGLADLVVVNQGNFPYIRWILVFIILVLFVYFKKCNFLNGH